MGNSSTAVEVPINPSYLTKFKIYFTDQVLVNGAWKISIPYTLFSGEIIV